MISKWFEVSVDLFSIIFNTYWKKKESWVYNNVIEIQNPNSISNNKSEERLYIGYKIDINDYEDVFSNYLKIQTMKKFEQIGYSFKDTYMSMCMLTEIGPDIIPIQKVDQHYQIILSTCFGTEPYEQLEKFLSRPLTSWYVKRDGKCIIGSKSNNDKFPVKDRFIRFRLINFDYWKRMISDYRKDNNTAFLQISEDLPKRFLRLC